MELSESWMQIIALFLANFSVILWFRAESRNDWRLTDSHIRAIQQEIKDFHGRLERQDAEFKSHMQYYHSPGKE